MGVVQVHALACGSSILPSLNMLLSSKFNYNSFLFLSEEFTWSNFYLLYFFTFFYIVILGFVLVYLTNRFTLNLKNKYSFLGWVINGDFLTKSLLALFSLYFLCILGITGPVSSIWHSHLIITNLQLKFQFFILVVFLLICYLYLNSTLFYNQSSFDFLLTIINLFIWINLMFFSSNLFTIVFFLEILSAAIMLFTSSSFYYSNINFKKFNYSSNNYLTLNLPYYQTSSLLFFFWTSFLASVSLFFYLLFFIYYFNTLDLFFLEYLFNFMVIKSSWLEQLAMGSIWFGFVFCVFLKCGLVPFFVWKPLFFKGLSYLYMFIYTCFYYFFLLIFFLIFFNYYFNFLFSYYLVVSSFMLLVGWVVMFSLMLNNTYLKSFFAISSILNTLFVFIVLLSSFFITL